MIFVDSNIPMYLVGADHPNKWRAGSEAEKLVGEKERLVTNTEVLQEILHRYRAINRTDFIQKAWDTLYALVDQILVVTEADVTAAKNLLFGYSGISARDALHASQMNRLKIETIFTFDGGFDLLPGIKRIPS